jgi:hypothetical protein
MTLAAMDKFMTKKSSAFAKLLASTFTEEELAYLEEQPHFHAAVATIRCFNEFERVCAIGQRLLTKRLRSAEALTV